MPIHTTSYRDIPFNYLHTGPTTPPGVPPRLDQGEVLVFIHGASGMASTWKQQLECFSRDRSPLAVDLPGHGNSGTTAGMTSIYDYRECIAALAADLQLRPFVIVGHSMGGAVALDFTLTYPERVRGLVLIGTGARLRVAPERLEHLKQALEGKRPLPADRSAYSPKTPDEVVHAIETETSRTDAGVRYNNMQACDAFDVMPQLKNITCPTLAICGLDDVITPPKYAEYFKANIPNCTLELIPDAGHWVHVEQADQVNAAIATFLHTLR
jgi:pimeloyl-ACP methyl ester carboxylesterase